MPRQNYVASLRLRNPQKRVAWSNSVPLVYPYKSNVTVFLGFGTAQLQNITDWVFVVNPPNTPAFSEFYINHIKFDRIHLV